MFDVANLYRIGSFALPEGHAWVLQKAGTTEVSPFAFRFQ
jgi:hypothetical protein